MGSPPAAAKHALSELSKSRIKHPYGVIHVLSVNVYCDRRNGAVILRMRWFFGSFSTLGLSGLNPTLNLCLLVSLFP